MTFNDIYQGFRAAQEMDGGARVVQKRVEGKLRSMTGNDRSGCTTEVSAAADYFVSEAHVTSEAILVRADATFRYKCLRPDLLTELFPSVT